MLCKIIYFKNSLCYYKKSITDLFEAMLIVRQNKFRNLTNNCETCSITQRHCSCIRSCSAMINIILDHSWHLCVSHLDFGREFLTILIHILPFAAMRILEISGAKILCNILWLRTANSFSQKLPPSAVFSNKKSWRCEIYSWWGRFLYNVFFTASRKK